ncbi:MAG: hypothetical protein AAF465_01605 [Pseudomonadota bacterium]
MKAKALTLVTLIAFTAPSFAGGFDKYDKNADGVITADELGEKKAHKLAKIDTNGDEMISQEEFDAYKAKKRSKKTY